MRMPIPYYDHQRNITIEIAPRGSGKTCRLLEAMDDFLYRDDRNVAHIFAMNEQSVRRIRGLIQEFLPHLDRERTKVWNVRNFGTVMGIRHPYSFINLSRQDNVMLFFDEFEFMEGEVPLLNNSYYSSSPARLGVVSNSLALVNSMENPDEAARAFHVVGDAIRFSRERDEVFITETPIIAPLQRRMRDGQIIDTDSWRLMTQEELETTQMNEQDSWFYRMGVKI